jgi:RNA-directed DNA polymerase
VSPIHLNKNDSTLRAEFLALQSPEDLAALLEIPYAKLCFYVYKKNVYKTFLIGKPSGSKRIITAPDCNIKIIQKNLSQVLYAVYGSRSSVHGFAKNRSVRSNARRHLGAKWLLNFDLQDFFPSIHFGRVKGLFSAKPYGLPEEVAALIARICCYQTKLPQGAPTSPVIANMICARMDSQFKSLAFTHGCIYTRYADDITFSTRANGFPETLVKINSQNSRAELGELILKLLKENNFLAHPNKTRLRGPSSCQEVTGIRINSGLNVRKKLLREIRAMLHSWETTDEIAAQNFFWNKLDRKSKSNEFPPFRAVLKGKIDFLGFVRGRDSAIHVRYLQRLQTLAPELSVRPIMVQPATHESVIRQAIWLLTDKGDWHQGTAFAIQGNFLLTAAHNLDHFMWASRPNFENEKYIVEEVWRDADRDLALGRIKGQLPVQLQISPPQKLDLTSAICVVGFPKYYAFDTVAFRFGRIVQQRSYVGIEDIVEHYIVDADIVKGNSGGPVLDSKNRVVGVAVKGLDIPGKLGDGDQLSSFVPVDKNLIEDALFKIPTAAKSDNSVTQILDCFIPPSHSLQDS